VIEEEADDAEVGFVVVEIELGAGGYMRCEDFRIDGEVEHGEVTPVRGQKRLQHSSAGRVSQIRGQKSEDGGLKPEIRGQRADRVKASLTRRREDDRDRRVISEK
jgi:hypothetical protein